jgi:hypothetical protein
MRDTLKSSINWLTFSNEDINKAREVLKNLEGEKTVDVIGLGTIFESVSNLIFPGTSTLHTKIRYQIFVPAIIYSLFFREKKIVNPEGEVNKLEKTLQRILLKNEDKAGIYGRYSS